MIFARDCHNISPLYEKKETKCIIALLIHHASLHNKHVDNGSGNSLKWWTIVYSGILTFLSSVVPAHTAATSDNDGEC